MVLLIIRGLLSVANQLSLMRCWHDSRKYIFVGIYVPLLVLIFGQMFKNNTMMMMKFKILSRAFFFYNELASLVLLVLWTWIVILETNCILPSFFLWKKDAINVRGRSGFGGANARRRLSLDHQGPIVVHQKPGPLQTIFNLLPDEVSFLYFQCLNLNCYLFCSSDLSIHVFHWAIM